MSKIRRSGGFLGRILRPLLTTGLPSMKNVLKSLDKSVQIPLRLTESAANAAKKIFTSGMTILTILNEEMNDIINMVKHLEYAGLLIKGIVKTIENKAKTTTGFLSACF